MRIQEIRGGQRLGMTKKIGDAIGHTIRRIDAEEMANGLGKGVVQILSVTFSGAEPGRVRHIAPMVLVVMKSRHVPTVVVVGRG